MPKHQECPRHLEIDCYSGCPFDCLYCVERDNWVMPSAAREEAALVARVRENGEGLPLYLSPKTDAYQPLEEKLGRTRTVLEAAAAAGQPFFVITKSPLVRRDAALFAGREAFIAVSLNTLDDELAALTEPGAPPPSARRALVAELCRMPGVRCVVKIDPILPGLTDGPRLEALLAWLVDVRPYAVTAETARLSRTIHARLEMGLPGELYRPLAARYPEPGDDPRHPEEGYRMRLFRGIERTLEMAGVRACFCRATVPEPLNDRDCRGGFA